MASVMLTATPRQESHFIGIDELIQVFRKAEVMCVLEGDAVGAEQERRQKKRRND
jgi:hypothetical protein